VVLAVTREERELIREARNRAARATPRRRARLEPAAHERKLEPRPRLGEQFPCGHSVAEHREWKKDPRCRAGGHYRCKTCRQAAKRAADEAKRRAKQTSEQGAAG
jgi:hypothetical protein